MLIANVVTSKHDAQIFLKLVCVQD